MLLKGCKLRTTDKQKSIYIEPSRKCMLKMKATNIKTVIFQTGIAGICYFTDKENNYLYHMSAVKLLPYYTYEDYCNWEGRWELIDGIPFAMSPAPSPRHQWIVVNILSELRAGTKKAKCACKVYDFVDVKVEEDTILQPDASIICGSISKKYVDFPPGLVVEILSDSTEVKDRITKFSIYEKFGIKYYLIADPDKESVEIYFLENSKYQLQQFSPETPFTFALSDDCNVDVLVKNFWE